MTYTLCVGEALVDFIAQAQVGDVGASEVFRRAPGGAPANVAVGIARLGGVAHFAGTVSRDAFGRFLLRVLAHENVGVDGVRLVDAHTTLAFVARGDQGQRDFVFIRDPGADSCLTASDITASEIEHARILHFGGVLLSSEPARSACLAAAACARAASRLVSFDVNARPALFASPQTMRAALFAGCSGAHLVKLSEEDLLALGLRLEQAADLIGGTTRAVVVSRGAAGCRWFFEGTHAGEIAAPALEPVDTTGAGDAMMAAILWRLAGAYDARLSTSALADAARYGCAAGAVACLREGAIPSLPSRPELDVMLSRVPCGA